MRGLTTRGLRRSGSGWRPAAWYWWSIWGLWAPGRTRRRQSVRLPSGIRGCAIVIPHLAQITPSVAGSREKRTAWEAQIDLGLLPNVWFDCASLPAYLPDEDYPYPSTAKFLALAIERIGPQKVFWGSDLPGLAGAMSYPQAVRLAKRQAEFLSCDGRAAFLGGTALQVFGQQE